MQPNGLDIKSIHPKNGDKYSPNLHKYLMGKRRSIAAIYATVYQDRNGSIWLGYRDEENWFMGARLITVLCSGSRTDTLAYPPSFGRGLIEVKGFWKQYVAHGRCAIDKEHDMFFIGDDNRWDVTGNRRHCKWCGKMHQERKSITETKVKEIWVQV
jgi:hypothetical protein